MSASHAQANSVTRDTTDAAPSTPIKRSAAQRQRAYRRRKRAAIEAIGEETSASRVALMTLLGHELAALEACDTPANLVEFQTQLSQAHLKCHRHALRHRPQRLMRYARRRQSTAALSPRRDILILIVARLSSRSSRYRKTSFQSPKGWLAVMSRERRS
jgi:hypothetical protein